MNTYHKYLSAMIIGFVVLGALFFGILAMKGTFAPKENDPGFSLSTSRIPLGPPKSNEPVRKTLDSFAEVSSPWRTRVTTATPPADGTFLAYYFDTTATSSLEKAKPFSVKSVDMHFVYSFFLATGKENRDQKPGGVSGENFGAYWIGSVTVPTTGAYDLRVTQSWSSMRVIIDGKLVFEGNTSTASVPLTLTKGSHTLEVEYESNYFSVNTSVNIAPAVGESEETLRALEHAGAKQWHITVYESGNADNRIPLTLPEGTYGPVILYVSSYETVHWDLEKVAPGTLSAIVISSYATTSNAINVPEGTKVFTRPIASGEQTFHTDINTEGNLKTYWPKSFILPGGVKDSIGH